MKLSTSGPVDTVTQVIEPDFKTHLGYDIADDSGWFADGKRVGGIVDAILATDLAPEITRVNEWDDDLPFDRDGKWGSYRPVNGAAAIREALLIGSGGIHAIDEAQSVLLVLDVAPDGFELSLSVGKGVLATRRKTILDSFEQIVVAVVDAMEGVGELKWAYTHVYGGGFDYPKVRPPVVHRRLSTSSILDVVDKNSVLALRAPSHVRRSAHGNAVILRWIDTLEDYHAVALATGEHELWISSIVPMERDTWFNEQGDLRVNVFDGEDRAPFTIFDTYERIGYKAIVVDPAGEPDAAIWRQMAEILAARENGLTAIRLIVPLREHAVALAPRAKAAGFDAILYPADGEHWDPDPPGWWADGSGVLWA